jgi:hypothetical protein
MCECTSTTPPAAGVGDADAVAADRATPESVAAPRAPSKVLRSITVHVLVVDTTRSELTLSSHMRLSAVNGDLYQLM